MQTTEKQWRELAQSIELRQGLFINGAFVPPTDDLAYEAINPATGECLSMVAIATESDVDKAVRAAREAFDQGGWSEASPDFRKSVLIRLAQLIRDNLPELALLETLNMGKHIGDASSVDIPSTADTFQWYAEAIDKVYGEVASTPTGSLAVVERVPLGVIGAVVPWNFPLTMAAWKIAPALAAGNSVVLKPAEQSPHSALRLAELAVLAGLPKGVLNVVTGPGEVTGKALGLHNDVDCIAFTGSTQVGKIFQRYAADSNMKQVWLECGGKSPNLVFADTDDLAKAAQQACFGIFHNQGQICSATSRVLVERSIHEDFVALLREEASNYMPGDPLGEEGHVGCMVDQQQADRVYQYIRAGKSYAQLKFGGNPGSVRASIEPTIFDNVDHSSPLAQEEIFGPVLVVIPFDDEDQAVHLANDNCYGLAASLWTGSLARALRVAKKLKVGTVSINAVDALSMSTPFGGFKQSGFGRDLSLHALDKYSGLKTTWIQFA